VFLARVSKTLNSTLQSSTSLLDVETKMWQQRSKLCRIYKSKKCSTLLSHRAPRHHTAIRPITTFNASIWLNALV